MQKKSGFKINLATHIVAVIALVVGILTTIFAFGNLPEKNIEGGAVEGVYSPVADNTQEVVIEDVEFLGGETFLRVKKGTEYTVKNCTFNGATNAAIIVEGGVLNLVDCEIKNSTSNISVDMGGWSEIYNTAICVNGGILNLLGTTRISGVTNSQGIVLVSEVDGFELNTVLNLGTSVSGEGEWIGSISGCESAIYTLGAEVNMNSGTLTGNNYGVDVNWTDIETKININSGEISNNTQNGIQAYGYNATITINGGKISNHENGYGIYSDDSTVTLKGGEICGNAGGICMSDDDVLTMTGGEIHDNESTYGAGIYSGGQYVNVQISGGKIYNNKATYGGGVCLCGDGSNGSYLTITGGNIYNNTAENGGGVYIDGSNISESDVSHVINDGAIYGNTATNGGGIYLLSSSLTINGGLIGNDDETNSIAGNTATTGYGGGIYSSGSTITMNGGHIGENVVSGASVYGGGVYLCEASTMTMGEMAVIDSNKTTGTSSCGGG
ncbi:MAG: hypothetical protein IJW24_01710, partial [Clostridia bacterium]|nr:hypothetical protein [Clostridia bacterium]